MIDNALIEIPNLPDETIAQRMDRGLRDAEALRGYTPLRILLSPGDHNEFLWSLTPEPGKSLWDLPHVFRGLPVLRTNDGNRSYVSGPLDRPPPSGQGGATT